MFLTPGIFTAQGYNNNNHNNPISIAPLGRDFRGAGGSSCLSQLCDKKTEMLKFKPKLKLKHYRKLKTVLGSYIAQLLRVCRQSCFQFRVLRSYGAIFFRFVCSNTKNATHFGQCLCFMCNREVLLLLLLQELVEDVAVATSSRHADLSWARHFAVASPRFIGRRSASTVLSQDCLGRPALRLQSPGESIMQASRAR